jgi:hypothetical protein
MCSSGIRLGAWDYLKWKHVTPIKNEKTSEVQAAKLLVYDGEGEEYFTFITPVAYRALKEWMDFRADCGEKITGESWLIRDRWRTADMQWDKCGRLGLAKYPKKLKIDAIKKMIEGAWLQEGVRPHALSERQRRYEFKGVHGFRKFFQTRAQQAMNLMNVELLMSHSLGIADSYYKPTYEQLFADYLKAVPLLTINNNNVESLKEQQEILEQKQEEKDQELERLKQEQRKLHDAMKLMDAKLRQVNNFLRAQNAQLREANAEMDKNL